MTDPKPGDRALMQVDVVGTEFCEDSGATSLIVECPNGISTIAAYGHLRPHVSAKEWEAIERLMLAARQHEHETRRNTQTIGGCELCDALLAAAPLIERMGW